MVGKTRGIATTILAVLFSAAFVPQAAQAVPSKDASPDDVRIEIQVDHTGWGWSPVSGGKLMAAAGDLIETRVLIRGDKDAFVKSELVQDRPGTQYWCNVGVDASRPADSILDCVLYIKAKEQVERFTFVGTRKDGTAVKRETSINVHARDLDVRLKIDGQERKNPLTLLRTGSTHSAELTVKNTTEFALTGARASWFNGDCLFPPLQPGESASCVAKNFRYDGKVRYIGNVGGGQNPTLHYDASSTAISPVHDGFPRNGIQAIHPDILLVSPSGQLHDLAGAPHSTFADPVSDARNSYQGMKVVRTGDWNDSGMADLWLIDTSGRAFLRTKSSYGHDWDGTTYLGAGWNRFVNVFSPGDLDGDGLEDVLAIDGKGDLYFYKRNADRSVGMARKVGNGWGMYTQVFPSGDVDGDGRPDVMAVDKAGALWLYRSTGNVGFSSRILKGRAGWNTYIDITSLGDVNEDGRHDLIAHDRDGALWWVENTGGEYAKRHLIRNDLKGWKLAH